MGRWIGRGDEAMLRALMTPWIRSAVLFSALGFSAARAEAPSPELLRRIGEADAKAQRVAHQSVLRLDATSVESDGDGKPLHQEHSVSLERWSNGQRQIEVLSATRDGQDNLAEARKKAGQRSGPKDPKSPFALDIQPHYRFQLLPPDSGHPSWTRLRFEPVDRGEENMADGEATVETETGQVLRLRCAPARRPPFVSKLELAFEYDRMSDGARALSRLVIDGAGGILFYQRRFHADIRVDAAPQ